jgi:tRNA G18 (ribose-2'-O)-methylase SpoU
VIVRIESAEDPRIASYRAVKERDLLRASSQFIVEGAIALERLVEAQRFPLDSLFLGETRLKPLAQLLERLDPTIPVYAAPQTVMDQVTGFHIHRGVLALARRSVEPSVTDLIAALGDRTPLTLLALVGLANHDNVGACFRNAAALGADAILLDAASCDPLYRKSIRVSSGAVLSLRFAHSGDGGPMLDALAAANIEPWALTPSNGEPIQKLIPPPRLALLLGAEGPGLSTALMDRCRRVSIPMAAGADSLNVATAGAIALSHVRLARGLTSRA